MRPRFFYVVTSMILRSAVYKMVQANRPPISFLQNNLGTFYSSLPKISPVPITSKYIRNIKNKHTFLETDVASFISENAFLKNTRLISISPGGFKGFYVLGICKYIKQHYDLTNYIFSGASAGAWNSLLLCYKGDIETIQPKLLDAELQNTKSIETMEKLIKTRMLDNFVTEDFDLRRLFIGVTTVETQDNTTGHRFSVRRGIHTNTTIFTGFHELEDALNCCIASSHIPLITGGFTNVYQNFLSYDGGFSNYPYLNITEPVLHISPNIWKKKTGSSGLPKTTEGAGLTLSDYTTLFSKDKFHFHKLVEEGYADAEQNKETLDRIFHSKH
jgi:Patatin-like phospholipase